jgi:hypothetical protein
VSLGVEIDAEIHAVAGWLGPCGEDDSPDISRGPFAAEVGLLPVTNGLPLERGTTYDHASATQLSVPRAHRPRGRCRLIRERVMTAYGDHS